MIMKARPGSPLDAHLVESLYQNLASEVLSSYADSNQIDRDFAKLWSKYSTSIGVRCIPWPKKTPANTPLDKRDKSIFVDTKNRSMTRQNRSPTLDVEKSDVKTSSLALTLSRGLTVADKRQLFEQKCKTAHKREHCSLEDNPCQDSIKKLKRHGSARDKKNFWENKIKAEEEAIKRPWKTFAKPNTKTPTFSQKLQVPQGKPIQENTVSSGSDEDYFSIDPVTTSFTTVLVDSEGKSSDSNIDLEFDGNDQSSHTIEDNDKTGDFTPEATDPLVGSKDGFSSLYQEPDIDECANLNDSSYCILNMSDAADLQLVSNEEEDKVTLAALSTNEGALSETKNDDNNELINSQSIYSADMAGSGADADFIYDDYDEYSSFDPKFTLSSKMGRMLGVNPENCKAFGNGLMSGRANHENIFYVSTEGAGTGFLTVGIQGPTLSQVKRITVEEERDNLYRVSYFVKSAGYYIIFVRYNDCFIMDSPFVCQVSDTDILV
jgi:hypothetical protein